MIMIDINIVDETIDELENADTTFINCQNLASLYIVRDHLKQSRLDKELFDIIPSYKQYCITKKKYQLKELQEPEVINDLGKVCKEISEFINQLYNNTESKDQRLIISTMVNELYLKIKG